MAGILSFPLIVFLLATLASALPTQEKAPALRDVAPSIGPATPAPAITTDEFVPHAGYETLRTVAQKLQAGIPLYTFGLQPVHADIEDVLKQVVNGSGDFGSCFSLSPNGPTCQMAQGLVLTFVIPILISIGSCIVMTCCACCGALSSRGCCGCCVCCKPPPPRIYSVREKALVAGIVAVLGVFILVFSAIGFSAGVHVSPDIDDTRNSINSWIGGVSAAVAGITPTIDASIQILITGASAAASTIQTPLDATLAAKNALVNDMSNIASNFTAMNSEAPGCNGCTTYHNAISSAANGLGSTDIPTVNFKYLGDELQQEVDSSIGSLTSGIDSVVNSFNSTQNSIDDARDSIRSYEKGFVGVVCFLFAMNWVILVAAALAFGLRLIPIWWLGYFICVLTVTGVWLMFGGFYPTGKILNEVCPLLPYPGGDHNLDLVDIFTSSQTVSGFITGCIVSNTGNLFTIFGFNTSAFTDATQKFSLDQQFNSSGVLSLNLSSQANTATQALNGISSLTANALFSNYATLPTSTQNSIQALLNQIQSTERNCEKEITTMQNSAVAAVQSVDTASNLLTQNLQSAIDNFLSIGTNCNRVGGGFVAVRGVLCDGIGREIDVVWFCCMVLGICLQYFPSCLMKAKVRFQPRGKEFKEDRVPMTGGMADVEMSSLSSEPNRHNPLAGAATAPGAGNVYLVAENNLAPKRNYENTVTSDEGEAVAPPSDYQGAFTDGQKAKMLSADAAPVGWNNPVGMDGGGGGYGGEQVTPGGYGEKQVTPGGYGGEQVTPGGYGFVDLGGHSESQV